MHSIAQSGQVQDLKLHILCCAFSRRKHGLKCCRVASVVMAILGKSAPSHFHIKVVMFGDASYITTRLMS